MWLKSFVGKGVLVVFVVGSVFLMQGCLNSEEVYDPNEFFDRDIELIENYITSNNLNASLDSLNSIYYVIHESGDGYRTVRNREVDMHYRGSTLGGAVFANTFTGTPERIYLGASTRFPAENPGDYVASLDEWLLFTASEGDSMTVFLPSAYAFEDKAFGVVDPNTPVMYTVKFVDIIQLSEDLEKIDKYISDNSLDGEIEPLYGTRFVKHEPGDPNIKIEMGDFININYEGKLLNDEVFDSNFGENPLSFELGGAQSSFIVGFELGLLNLNQNDSATFFIPSIYGYGKDGSPPDIPGNTPLAFTIKVGTVVKNN